jgi:formylglycine-generating enzyme required for sulfatase activity
VEIARPFALGRAPVTVAQWARYLTSKQIDRPDGEDDGPIVNVSWHDACEYVAWLSAQVRQRYRLPTEAEWEYAARGNQPETLYWWGDDITPDLAHYGRSIGCAPVEQLKANAFGLYDVHGNVAEWVADSYSEYRSGTSNGSALVLDDELELRSVVRGGSWASHPRALRCASRRPRTKTESSPDIGFRVARDIV